jgi:predicted nucleic acid-binding protein
MRPAEEQATRALFSALVWHPVEADIAELAGAFGRQWLPHYRGIDSADLAIAATAQIVGAPLLTMNPRHFPMFQGLQPPYEPQQRRGAPQ